MVKTLNIFPLALGLNFNVKSPGSFEPAFLHELFCHKRAQVPQKYSSIGAIGPGDKRLKDWGDDSTHEGLGAKPDNLSSTLPTHVVETESCSLTSHTQINTY